MKPIVVLLLALALAGCHVFPDADSPAKAPEKRTPFVATPCSTINDCAASIKRQVEYRWVITPDDVKSEKSVTVVIELNDQFEVTSIVVRKSSGSDRFDRNAIRAVQAAQPFSQLGGLVPEDLATFRRFVFKFKPSEIEGNG